MGLLSPMALVIADGNCSIRSVSHTNLPPDNLGSFEISD